MRMAMRLTILMCCLMASCAIGAEYRSPIAVLAAADGRTLYVAEHTGQAIALVDPASRAVTGRIALPEPPAGMALSRDGRLLYVCGAAPAGRIQVIDVAERRITGAFPAGHTPTALAVAPDGATLWVCSRFTNEVLVLDARSGACTARIAVRREPMAIAVTPDGLTAVVANHLPAMRADGDEVQAEVTLIDVPSRGVAKHLLLATGSIDLKDLCLSPDGRHAYITHTLGHFMAPTTQLERGWMNTNAVSVIDLGKRAYVNTVLLDTVEMGSANPWGVGCTADGRSLVITHAGSHELTVIDRPGMHQRLDRAAAGEQVTSATGKAAAVPDDLGFLADLFRRIRLPGNGPRGLAVVGSQVWAAAYFSDALLTVDLADLDHPRSVPLAPEQPLTVLRRGERAFHDADRCYQRWQSCASCHPDARADGLNWDLMNDGLGNPKNTKSMLLSHQTPPVMSLGIRSNAEMAVRAGFRHIQFTVPDEEECLAVDEYLKALKPVPSPHLVAGRPGAPAQRGAEHFDTHCAGCHPAPLYSDLKLHTVYKTEGRDEKFDTPTLIEVWRTAPWLFDGSATTLQDAILRHYKPAKELKREELDDLVAFVLTL